MGEFEGKVAIVTGAARGPGRFVDLRRRVRRQAYVEDAHVPAGLEDKARAAKATCPEQAIIVEEDGVTIATARCPSPGVDRVGLTRPRRTS